MPEARYRHIFIAAFKDGLSEDVRARELADLKAMKENIPGILDLQVGTSLGLAGPAGHIVMTVDFASKEDFEVYMTHPYHTDYIARTGEACCKPDSFCFVQMELGG